MKRPVIILILLVCFISLVSADATFNVHTDYFGGLAGENLGNLTLGNISGGVVSLASNKTYFSGDGDTWGGYAYTRINFMRTDPVRVNFTYWWPASYDVGNDNIHVSAVLNSSNYSSRNVYGVPNVGGTDVSGTFVHMYYTSTANATNYTLSIAFDGLGNISTNGGATWTNKSGIPLSYDIEFGHGDYGSKPAGFWNVSIDTYFAAAFSCSPTVVALGNSVACTDTSSGNPATWKWYFGDGNTSILQNPIYPYPFTGVFNVNLSVNNTVSNGWNNKSAYITVTNASGFNQQDIKMTPRYILTVKVTDTSNMPIPVTTILDSNSQSYTTSNGTGYLTESYGAVITYVAATGYISRSMPYVIDGDRTVTIQLTTATVPSSPYVVKYPPKDVRFHVQTLPGLSLSLAYVTAVPIQTTLGNWAYLASLFGYDYSSVPINNLTLTGYTDSRGDITFAMMPDAEYSITTLKSGYTFQPLNITPHDDNYLIIADYAGSIFVTNGTSPAASVSFTTMYTRINQTAGFINISYVDVAGLTTSGKINITQTNKTVAGSPRVLIAGATFSGNSSWKNFTLVDGAVAGCSGKTSVVYSGTGSIVACLNQTLVEGGSYQTAGTGYTPSGIVYETGTAWFKSINSPIAGLSPEFALFIALGIMMFTSLMAGTSTGPAISFVVTFEGWVMYGMNMFVLMDGPMVANPETGATGSITLVPSVLTVMTIITIVWLFVEYRRKGK